MNTATTKMQRRDDDDMGYETKVILKAIIKIMQNSKDLREAIEAVKDIANAEDVVSDSDIEKK